MSKDRWKATWIMIKRWKYDIIKSMSLWTLIFVSVFLAFAFIRIDIVIDEFTYPILSLAIFLIPIGSILLFLLMVGAIYKNWAHNALGHVWKEKENKEGKNN
ncbi:MAG: hypothetical protein ACOC44_12325 [Promethearchaeia archaeon]